ncbi:MAG: integration host factor [Myxococcales bacterium]|nr:integration host factor [Myxococcales bacterium]|tara:strand:+ start:1744 stop:2028 length:285 start_codon:yes stop_codon:yes gene_type:complete
MSKKKIIDAVALKYPNLTKAQVSTVIDATFNTISNELNNAGDKYTHPAFGTWTVKTRDARMGVNPANPSGPKIQIGPSASIGFKPSTNLKSTFN